LHRSLFFFAETLEEIRTEKIERYKTHREVEVRERDRERIEVDAGADTKTTTKMWKNKGKKTQVAIETHTRLRGPRGLGFSHGLDPPQLQPRRGDTEPPDAG
jgi:hypothetical protein